MTVNADGSLEFYGSGVDTRYTGYGVYFLINGDSPGMRINTELDSGADTSIVNSFYLKVTERPRVTYVSDLVNGDNENWFGPTITPNADAVMPIVLSNVAPAGQNSFAQIKVRLQGYYGAAHLVTVRFNNYTVGTVSFANQDAQEFVFDVPASEVINGVNNFYFRSSASTYDFSLIDEVSVIYERNLAASGEKIRFGVSSGDSAIVEGFANNNFKVYEIYPNNARRHVDVQGLIVNGTNGFSLASDSRNREFVAVADVASEPVAMIETNDPSSWHDTSNTADFIIVAPKVFGGQADSIATMRNSQGLLTRVVYIEDIADEFGYGVQHPDALRTFFLHATSFWAVNPGYVMLFGDSSYDYRNYLGMSNPKNFIHTKMVETQHMETSSDSWLVDFNDDGVEDISLGRYPIRNNSEANKAVTKLARYDSYVDTGNQTAALVADQFFEILNGELDNRIPNSVDTTIINRTELGDSVTRQAILDHANSGPSMVSYLGHGTTVGWTSASLFKSNDANGLSNTKLSFYMLMTCLNGYMSDANSDGFAEKLLKAPNGAVAVWASSGSTYASGQISMSQQVAEDVFQNNQKIGDIVRLAKHTSPSIDARYTWNLFGDPTVQIY